MSSGAVLRWARAVAPHLSSQLVTAASLQRMDNLLDIVRAALPSAPLADPLAGGVAVFVQSLCDLGVVKAPLAAEVMRNVLDGDCMMLYVALIRFVALRLLGVSSVRRDMFFLSSLFFLF